MENTVKTMTKIKPRTNLLIGIGQPLLDISAPVQKEFLVKYDLKENDAVLASEKHQYLLKELIEKYEVNYTVGGSIQNTLRIIQWLTEVPKLTTFFGSVAKDEFSNILYKQATLDEVNVQYTYNSEKPTGTCVVLITGNNRSLCTNPGSSKLFDVGCIRSPENKILLDMAEYYYMGGFFLNVSSATVTEIATLATENNRQFLFNLSAPFICHAHKDVLLELFPYIDVLFGNKSEIGALANCFQLGTKNTEEIVLTLSNWHKSNNAKSRIVILTQGEDPVIAAKGKELLKCSVPEIDNEKIVDTNGAGDAFVGGFISQYIQHQNVEICVKCGIWAASKIIQRIGCTYEGRANFQI